LDFLQHRDRLYKTRYEDMGTSALSKETDEVLISELIKFDENLFTDINHLKIYMLHDVFAKWAVNFAIQQIAKDYSWLWNKHIKLTKRIDFELYLKAIKASGGNTQTIEKFLNQIESGISPKKVIHNTKIASPVKEFLLHFLHLKSSGKTYLLAASLTTFLYYSNSFMILKSVNNLGRSQGATLDAYHRYIMNTLGEDEAIYEQLTYFMNQLTRHNPAMKMECKFAEYQTIQKFRQFQENIRIENLVSLSFG
jgi:hypothetical protein